MSAQRAGSDVAADRRSIHPGLPGFPWWGAVVIAASATVAGVAFDAGTKELSHLFAALYVLGCVTAVLTVQQSGVFTAVIQPPLLLFCAVPGAYWWFHGGASTGIKAIVINCGYPLIERFPLMLFTAAGVLLVGMIRWYLGMSAQLAAPKADAPAVTRPARLTVIFEQVTNKLAGFLHHDGDCTAGPIAPARRRADERRRRSTADCQHPPRRQDSGKGSAASRSRHLRPPTDDRLDHQRRRPGQIRADQPPPRRRPRPSMDPYQPEPRRRQPQKPGSGGNGIEPVNGTHHPISRVRYRGADNADF